MTEFVASSPYFRGDEEIAPNSAEKCDGALIWSVVVAKRLNNRKREKYSFERGIVALHFDENYANLP